MSTDRVANFMTTIESAPPRPSTTIPTNLHIPRSNLKTFLRYTNIIFDSLLLAVYGLQDLIPRFATVSSLELPRHKKRHLIIAQHVAITNMLQLLVELPTYPKIDVFAELASTLPGMQNTTRQLLKNGLCDLDMVEQLYGVYGEVFYPKLKRVQDTVHVLLRSCKRETAGETHEDKEKEKMRVDEDESPMIDGMGGFEGADGFGGYHTKSFMMRLEFMKD